MFCPSSLLKKLRSFPRLTSKKPTQLSLSGLLTALLILKLQVSAKVLTSAHSLTSSLVVLVWATTFKSSVATSRFLTCKKLLTVLALPIAQAEAKSIRELKRDIEATLASANDRAVEDGSSTAYALRGLGDWLDSNGPSDVPAGFRTPAASIYTAAEAAATEFGEEALNDIITSIFEQTGSTNDLMLVADTGLRRVIADFARTSGSSDNSVRNVNYDGGSGQITLRVDMYESDHGMVSIVNGNPSCMPNFGSPSSNSSGYLINPEYAGIHELIALGSTRLPNQGGGERGYVDCALTLGVYHPQAHGLIQDVT